MQLNSQPLKLDNEIDQDDWDQYDWDDEEAVLPNRVVLLS